MMWRLMTTVP